MVDVQCRICGKRVQTAYWVKLGIGTDEGHGWVCLQCYDKLWNIWYHNPV